MQIPDHFVIPVSALRQDNTIWTVAEGILRIESVQLVRQEGESVVLLAPDLSEGTQIIISDITLVSDGMRVQVSSSTTGAIN